MMVSGWFSLLVSSAGAKLVHLTSVPYSRADYFSSQSTEHKFTVTSQEIDMSWLIESFSHIGYKRQNVHHQAKFLR